MKSALALAVLAGTALGAAAVSGLNAQTKSPGAYVIVDISDITDVSGLKAYLPKTGPAIAPFGGNAIARTENIVALDGTPPKRFAIIAFDSIEKAKAWDDSAAMKEINSARLKSTKSRSFIVDGALN